MVQKVEKRPFLVLETEQEWNQFDSALRGVGTTAPKFLVLVIKKIAKSPAVLDELLAVLNRA